MNTYQLKHQAKLLQERAREMIKMAKEIESMPDPIGPVIGEVVAMLARHGLCVIERHALKMISDYAIECKLDGESWPAGMHASSAAASDALEKGAA